MTGSSSGTRSTLKSSLSRWLPATRRYFAIDGGSGAHLLAELPSTDIHLQPVHTPRHADLLIIVGPVSPKLAPALADLARAVPQPAAALLIEPPSAIFPQLDALHIEDLLSRVQRIDRGTPSAIVAVALDRRAPLPMFSVSDGPAPEPDTIPLPPEEEREIPTELAVLSLGPVQPLTAGPLRLLLICDGEQVYSAQVETGYAHRGITEAMVQADWRHAANLAGSLDPLAPVAGRLALVRAVERLQGWEPPAHVAMLREAALALERAQDHLWWLARFAGVLALHPLADNAIGLASTLQTSREVLWEHPLLEWIAPRAGVPDARDHSALATLQEVAARTGTLAQHLQEDRLLGLRTRGIGIVTREQAQRADVTGPVLEACEGNTGDVHCRLLIRVKAAQCDVQSAAEWLTHTMPEDCEPRWDAPSGRATGSAEGPRGRIAVYVTSIGGSGPAALAWERPSAALLRLLPDALAGQKLADAQVILASFDLATAEADG